MFKAILYLGFLFFAMPIAGKATAAPDMEEPQIIQPFSSIENLWFERLQIFGNAEFMSDEEVSELASELLDKIYQQKMQEGRENLFPISAELYLEALESLREHRIDKSLQLLEYAVKFSPAMHEPYFQLAKMYFWNKGYAYKKSWEYLLKGGKSYFKNLHGLIIDSGNIFLFLLLSFMICLVIYIPFIVISYIPLVYHDVVHLVGGVKAPWKTVVSVAILVAFFLIPLIPGQVSWEYLFIILILCGCYFRNRDIFLASVFFFFLIASPVLFRVAVSFLHYSKSQTKDIVHLHMSIHDFERMARLDQQFKKKPFKNKHLVFSLGNFYLKNREFQKAITYFEYLINLDPEFATAYNNLGSAYFYAGKYESTKLAYSRAIELNPLSAATHFNLSRLSFTQRGAKEQQAYLKTAKAINPDLVSQYMKKDGGVGSKYLIIENLNPREIFLTLFAPTKEKELVLEALLPKTFGRFNYTKNTKVGLIGLAILLAFNMLFRYFRFSRYCTHCNGVECVRCHPERVYSDVCAPCQDLNLQQLDPSERIFQTIKINKRHKRISFLAISLSFLIPGSGHYFIGKSFMGLMISMVFFVFLLKAFFFNGVVIDAYDLSLIAMNNRYVVFLGLLGFFIILIIQNIFYEVRTHNER